MRAFLEKLGVTLLLFDCGMYALAIQLWTGEYE